MADEDNLIGFLFSLLHVALKGMRVDGRGRLGWRDDSP